MSEFGIIEEILSPLASHMPGALGLTDDAALLQVAPGQELVLTKDAMVAGVHFLEQDQPARIAKKLLRTNLSDLAAMGAKPIGYLLATAWTPACDHDWISAFAHGLKEDQDFYGLGLLGGDTVKTPGPLTLTLTALGSVPKGAALRRNSAKVGDRICVSGTIGDGALGLLAATGKIPGLANEHRAYLEDRYFLPQPRLALGQALIGWATSCLDISDGLLADFGHICQHSRVAALIYKADIPLSMAARACVQKTPEYWTNIFSGGDDYELAFTVPAENVSHVQSMALEIGVQVTPIGEITKGNGVEVMDERGRLIPFNSAGWTHF